MSIRIGSNFYEKVKTLKYLDSVVTNKNSIQEEIKLRLKAGIFLNIMFFAPLGRFKL